MGQALWQPKSASDGFPSNALSVTVTGTDTGNEDWGTASPPGSHGVAGAQVPPPTRRRTVCVTRFGEDVHGQRPRPGHSGKALRVRDAAHSRPVRAPGRQVLGLQSRFAV